MQTEDDLTIARAVERLSRPGAWLDQAGAHYRIRIGADRRRRPVMVLDEATFRALVRRPGLSPRQAGGGWRLAARPTAPDRSPPPGRPGVIDGAKTVVDPQGGLVVRRANLGASALAWLAARKDAHGRPWLDGRETAAAERLQADHEKAGVIGRLTMNWDAGPKSPASYGAGVEPAELAWAAKHRLSAALGVMAPRERAVVEQVVLQETPLQEVERRLGLGRRTARPVLKAGLVTLADHYRIG